MAISTKTVIKQTQKIALTQRLIQSINLLQLSNMELAEKISDELLENPVLEEDTVAITPETVSGDRDIDLISGITKELSGDDSVLQKNEDNEMTYDNFNENQYAETAEDDRKRSFIENAIIQEETLKEHLGAQAHLLIDDDSELSLIDSIISSLDDNGFLISPKDDISRENNVAVEMVEKAISFINTLDPAGCGAANVHESLRIQAKILYPGDELLHRLLNDHFTDLEKMQHEKIEKALHINTRELIEKNRLIQNLNPFPGRFYGAKNIKYIIPDIEVKLIADEIHTSLNDDWIPGIRINSYYKNIFNKKDIDKNLRHYLKEKIQSAKYLVESISNRRDTIIKIVRAIMECQREFLMNGTGYLKPLVYSEIAKETGMHESTVSRVANNKYVQTPWGIFELKSFFSSRLKSENETSHSSDEVINLIKNIIENESPQNPFTDEEIVNLLKEKNINIARRTIAKYRGIINISSSNIRKKINKINNKR
ncbi:MAG: RNA polymerase factor sigma-54 [Spirochaetes bacterium]|nr:RNA polymerase factor sigma-54 [Spirochaetota bacterium]